MTARMTAEVVWSALRHHGRRIQEDDNNGAQQVHICPNVSVRFYPRCVTVLQQSEERKRARHRNNQRRRYSTCTPLLTQDDEVQERLQLHLRASRLGMHLHPHLHHPKWTHTNHAKAALPTPSLSYSGLKTDSKQRCGDKIHVKVRIAVV
jgi:hypothetical protein